MADMELKRGRRVNVERVLRMAVLHDLSESLTFDISKEYLGYLGEKGEAIKGELEAAAWKHIMAGLEEPNLRRHYSAIQKEFDAGRTVEAQIVHAADRLDILLQVIQYRRKGYPASLLADLWKGTNSQLRHSRITSARRLRQAIIREGERLAALQVK